MNIASLPAGKGSKPHVSAPVGNWMPDHIHGILINIIIVISIRLGQPGGLALRHWPHLRWARSSDNTNRW